MRLSVPHKIIEKKKHQHTPKCKQQIYTILHLTEIL